MKKILLIAAIALSMSTFTACNNTERAATEQTADDQPMDIKDVVDVEESNSTAEGSEAAATNGNVEVIDFYATWCGPCKMLTPMLEKMESKYKDKIRFTRIDVDAQSDIAMQYNIKAMPTLVYLVNGKEVNRTVGLPDETSLDATLANLVK